MSSFAFPFRERLLRLATREARDDGLSPVFSCGPPGGVSGSSFSIALGVACSLVSPSLLSSTGARTFASETEKEENRARLCRTKKHLFGSFLDDVFFFFPFRGKEGTRLEATFPPLFSPQCFDSAVRFPRGSARLRLGPFFLVSSETGRTEPLASESVVHPAERNFKRTPSPEVVRIAFAPARRSNQR